MMTQLQETTAQQQQPHHNHGKNIATTTANHSNHADATVGNNDAT